MTVKRECAILILDLYGWQKKTEQETGDTVQVILKPNSAVMHILGKAKASASGYRLMTYCVEKKVSEGVLLFHVLTREMLLLSWQEHEDMLESAYLREHWFVVPQETDDKALTGLARWALASMRRKPKYITSYTILTTTDCNARCFYCYEKGGAKITMSDKTARDTAAYIKAHCGGKRVRFSWFGGEPMLNTAAIDRICGELHDSGIQYVSTMTSNAYLFDEETIRRAKEQWHLGSIQITLDGTEDVYNRSKAYVCCEGSAYQVVMKNIDDLLSAGIKVSIRLNLGEHNVEDLNRLAGVLAQRFAGKRGISVYVRLLYNISQKAQQKDMYDALFALEDRLAALKLLSPGISETTQDLRLTYCMVESDSAALVTPDGRLGLCEHYPDCGFFGHVCSQERDEAVIAEWRKRYDEQAECAGCFYYPACVRLKKCSALGACTQYWRMDKLRVVQRSMEHAYRRVLRLTKEKEEKEAQRPSC